jgi:hypothetical protein
MKKGEILLLVLGASFFLPFCIGIGSSGRLKEICGILCFCVLGFFLLHVLYLNYKRYFAIKM